MNAWLKERISQFEKRGLSRTYVLVEGTSPAVRGYYVISNHSVVYQALPAEQAKGVPQISVPVVLLGKLAVDRAVQGEGLGEFLLLDALRRAEYLAHEIGIRAVEVDAIDDAARRFYLKYGFTPLLDDRNHLFLPMSVIRKLGLPPLKVT
ncbi:MAG: GNAT family N-acetyltransferase [Planctomycetia bacterium]|nr:GNAT family N-acetyltransferase [Planctomycetia bacterium]